MLELMHLRKEFKNVVAVADLSFRLEAGDIFGFIGPNGAGKTTTIRMLATLLPPTRGTASIDGVDILEHPEEVRGVIGYMPDYFGVYDDVTVWEYLDFFAAAYRISREKRKQIIDDVLELADLTGKRENYVEELSRGMKQRLCLAKTLVHDPKLLLLDEPASGLDPRARIEIKELLKELKAMGKTILISSHILPELADMCNKIGIIEQGQLIISGPVEAIMREVSGGRALEIEIDGEAQRAAEVISAFPQVKQVKVTDSSVQVQLGPEEFDRAALLRALVDKGIPVKSFKEVEADLEDIFMKVTRGVVQ
jgi:ABC-2 type transport system ATP-binding protein